MIGRPAEVPAGRARGRGRARSIGFLVALSLLSAGSVAVAAPSGARTTVSPCSWRTARALLPQHAASTAALVDGLMTLTEKIDFIGLHPLPRERIEKANSGVKRLCLPRLILRDGPVGLAAGASGVTAFPSELSLAATFDPALAVRYGNALGREAYLQGTMGIQGPGLNLSVFDNWGRSFENLGQDPTLTSALGARLISGIQQTGAFAVAKHLGTYVQESTRFTANALVSPRAEQELYLAPFRAAAHAGVASFMCALGSANGVENCANGANVAEMHQFGFDGFVRTDSGASSSEVAALKSGVDLLTPYDPSLVASAIASGTLPLAVLDRAVRDVLAVMLRYREVGAPISPDATRAVDGPAEAATGLLVAERSMVLLKDNGVLPLTPPGQGSIAVIGSAAAQAPVVSGGGSSEVTGADLTTDLAGITPLGAPGEVSYTPAASASGVVPLALGTTSADPLVHGFQEAPLTLPPTMTGLVDFAYRAGTPTRLVLDGTTFLQNVGTTSIGAIRFEKSIQLSKGTHTMTVVWPAGLAAPVVTAQPVDGLLQQAAAAAHAAATAIVVVGARDSEGVDRTTLGLPGYQDQLVEAVAAANPRTIVVVHSGGPVLMPWLGAVAAIVEAWYPGQVAGTALGAVLSGAVDPSGRLPMAFPRSDALAPMIRTSWPTAALPTSLVALGDLGVGSRWFQAHAVTPLFAFGYGLTYTSFSVGAISASSADRTVVLHVPVTDTGARAGRYVALADVTYPTGSGEPPGELKSFGVIDLRPKQTAVLTMRIPFSTLAIWRGTWGIAVGSYGIAVGNRLTSVGVVG